MIYSLKPDKKIDSCIQSSDVVVHVPSWLKFSYLSELLVSILATESCPRLLSTTPQEASIADISYLFEEDALVDFTQEELVNLVRALFADTPQRANMINKLTNGHHPQR